MDVSRERFRILPGAIDIHVHLRDLEYSYKEDYFTGTSAAACGGVVLVCDMPNTKPPTNTPNNLMLKIESARSKALVDYGLYYGVPSSKNMLRDVARYIVGFKFYPEDIFEHFNREVYSEILKLAVSNNLTLVFHAENPKMFNYNAPPGFERPWTSEYSAIQSILALTHSILRSESISGVKIHITHVSSAKSIELLVNAKRVYRDRIKLTFDTTLHHLLLDNSLYRFNPGLYKVYPTLKTRLDNLRLYLGLLRREVDALVTDHAPHSLSEKVKPYSNALPGYPGLEIALPILLTMVDRGLLTLEDIVYYYSYSPSRILGLEGFGVISRGAYASLTIVDLKTEWRVNPDSFMSKAKYTPFNGWSLKGKPYITIVRGRIVFENGIVYEDLKGWGRNVRELT